MKSILSIARSIEGRLDEAECRLLLATAASAAAASGPLPIVEVGSYCGRSTVILAGAARAVCPTLRIFAIDPHQGSLSHPKGELIVPPTLERFLHNIEWAGVADRVDLIQKKSFEVKWDLPVALLFIDGLHDYENVRRDFLHFQSFVVPGGLVAFDDNDGETYPGVVRCVGEAISSGGYEQIASAGRLVVLRKGTEDATAPIPEAEWREIAIRRQRAIELLRDELLSEIADSADALPEPAFEILKVEASGKAAGTISGSIDIPAEHTTISSRDFTVAGWVLGHPGVVAHVEIRSEGELVSRVPVCESRPDVALAFPAKPNAAQCGFRFAIDLSRMSVACLEVWAIPVTGHPRLLGTIRARRRTEPPA